MSHHLKTEELVKASNVHIGKKIDAVGRVVDNLTVVVEDVRTKERDQVDRLEELVKSLVNELTESRTVNQGEHIN